MSKREKLYQAIAADLSHAIAKGVYLAGDKLPSIRDLSQQKKVSIATIQRALEELESMGVIFAKPKSGFYVRVAEKQNSQLEIPVLPMVPKYVEIHQFASELFHQCEQPEVQNLGISYPDVHYYPTKSLQKITRSITKSKMGQVLEVHFSAGHNKLRKILSQRLNLQGCHISPDDIIVTNGCLEALSLCLRAVAKPGDTIAIESPGFVGLFQLIESLGYQAIEIPCHPTDGLSIEALELAIEQWDIKAVAIVPTFSNPSGSTMPESRRKQLVDLLAEKMIPLIEDDLFSDLSFDGSRIKPCKAFDKKGLVLYCASASKTIASGLRVGWIAPGAFLKEVSYFKTFTNISAPNITQMVVAEFYQSGNYDRYIRQLTAAFAKRMFQLQSAIERYFPEGTQISRPQGGVILWVKLPDGVDGFQLFKLAIKENIAILPGQLSSATHKFNQFIRLNCASNPDIDFDSVIAKLTKLIEQLRLKAS